MPKALTFVDRLRIERVVWSLDQRLYDLPRKSRIAKRREVRDNLRDAAQDLGTGTALGRLGSSEALAKEYLSAEFGDSPRHSWLAAAVFAMTGILVFTSLLTEATLAFGDGITSADSGATGTFTWDGIRWLQTSVTYTFTNGDGDYRGGAMSPLAWALWIVGTILVGRLWRAVPMWRRRQAAPAA